MKETVRGCFFSEHSV